MAVILAAGTLPWRRARGGLEVAVVHRPKYDDWSWPKGKLDPGELPPAAAVRETAEETGLQVSLGRPLPSTTYTAVDGGGHVVVKQVAYWAAEALDGAGDLLAEVDAVEWLDIGSAGARLSYARDRDQLRALLRAERSRALDTWPLAVVRHARARPRSSWRGKKDELRPLDRTGLQQAQDMVPVLAAFGITRVVSSSSTRCVTTLAPYARACGTSVTTRRALSEEAFAVKPGKAVRAVERLLDDPRPAAVCSHGPVLPALLRALARRAVAPSGAGDELASVYAEAARDLEGAADPVLAKGEMIVCHITGSGRKARVVATERHRSQPR